MDSQTINSLQQQVAVTITHLLGGVNNRFNAGQDVPKDHVMLVTRGAKELSEALINLEQLRSKE